VVNRHQPSQEEKDEVGRAAWANRRPEDLEESERFHRELAEREGQDEDDRKYWNYQADQDKSEREALLKARAPKK
jgi:hypothetical protein